MQKFDVIKIIAKSKVGENSTSNMKLKRWRMILLIGSFLILSLLFWLQSNQEEVRSSKLNKQTSSSSEGTIDLLLVILSGTNQFSRRKSVRDSYASASQNNTNNIRYFFILGIHPKNDSTVKERIREESRLYNDVIQAKFMDTYLNLTTKVIKGLQWALKTYRHTKYIMKLDDDTWLNVPKTLEFLNKTNINFTHNVIAKKRVHAKPFRNPKSKFYVSKREFNHPYYPDYCDGSGYIMTPEVAHAVVLESRTIPYFKFEDVYIGMCLKKLDFVITDLRHMTYEVYSEKTHPCSFKNTYLIAHKVSPSYMHRIWNANCTKQQKS